MTVKKGDFIEIEFTGEIADSGEVFDTNILDDAKAAHFDIKNIEPFVLAVGERMLPESFDADLEGKEEGKSYKVEISPEKAFGKRNSKFIRMIPTKLFHEQKIDPQRGMQLALDGQLVKVLSSSGGRTLVDFNNPLAGKKIIYKYTIKRIISDEKEKVDALSKFLFRKKLDFEKKDNTVVFKIEKELEPFMKLFAPKFEKILGLKIEGKVEEKNK